MKATAWLTSRLGLLRVVENRQRIGRPAAKR